MTTLSERKKKILQAVVQDYIETAEPVGSQTLVQRYPLQLSSATVRNVMAELEAEGYLEQPHTSAGRRPSDRAYRFYVDALLNLPIPSETWKLHVRTSLEATEWSVPALAQKASALLTERTGYAAFSLTPSLSQDQLLQVRLIPLQPGRVLLVLVFHPGVVRDRILRLPDLFGPEVLKDLAEQLERQLRGLSIQELTWMALPLAHPLSETGTLDEREEDFLQYLLFEAYQALRQAEDRDAHWSGMSNLLSYPEFKDPQRAKALFDSLLQNEALTELYEAVEPEGDLEDGRGLAIRIGQELALPGLEDCSFLLTSYRIGHQTTGLIGLVGPKRMPYQQVIAEIGFVRQELQNRFRNEENPDDE